MARIMVTGNWGFIGTRLTQFLQMCGHQVKGLDAGWFQDQRLHGAQYDYCPTICKDIRDSEPRDFAGCEAVVHLAALSNDPLSDLDPTLTFEINHRAAVRVAKAAKAAGVHRFVFFSSCSVYGKTAGIVDENGAVNPLTAYATAKLLAERDLLDLQSEHFQVVVLRNATVFGFSARQRLDLIIPDMCAAATLCKQVVLRSAGLAQRPHVALDDLCCLTETLATWDDRRPETVPSLMNVVGFCATAKEVATAVGEIAGCPVVQKNAGSDARDYLVDGSLAMTFGWAPVIGLRDGITQVLDAFSSLPLQLSACTDKICVRLARIKQLIADGRLVGDLRWRGLSNARRDWDHGAEANS